MTMMLRKVELRRDEPGNWRSPYDMAEDAYVECWRAAGNLEGNVECCEGCLAFERATDPDGQEFLCCRALGSAPIALITGVAEDTEEDEEGADAD